jgi:hypothetical protein
MLIISRVHQKWTVGSLASAGVDFNPGHAMVLYCYGIQSLTIRLLVLTVTAQQAVIPAHPLWIFRSVDLEG